jgi:hypothetical protein
MKYMVQSMENLETMTSQDLDSVSWGRYAWRMSRLIKCYLSMAVFLSEHGKLSLPPCCLSADFRSVPARQSRNLIMITFPNNIESINHKNEIGAGAGFQM